MSYESYLTRLAEALIEKADDASFSRSVIAEELWHDVDLVMAKAMKAAAYAA